MIISPARPADIADALALLYGHRPASLAENIAHAFHLIARGDLDPAHLLVARVGDELRGAVFGQRLLGAAAVVWPPRARDDNAAVQDALARAVIDHLAGTKVLQTFLPPEDAPLADPLLRAGFRHITRVWQMARAAGTSPPGPEVEKRERPPLTIVPFSEVAEVEFQRTLMKANDDSLDCPELTGTRTTSEVLAGYREAASDQSRWWLARLAGESVGVLILGDNELCFVGVVPKHRVRGVGRALMEAACGFAVDLNLIVDVRNDPAVRLYRSFGFEIVGAREVFLKLSCH